MSKITRKTAELFASAAGPTQVGQFGSFAAGSPMYSSDPAVIQSLSEWEGGWNSAIIGNNSPCIEDMNAFCLVMAYQIAYMMQEGVAEWDSGTTYYVGSIVNDGNGNLYVSTYNGNLNNVITNVQYWLPYKGASIDPTIQTFTSGSGTYIPSFVFVVSSANATAGATYTNNGQTFTVSATISAGSQLITTGTGAPSSTGILTLATGTGDSTITFVQVKNPIYIEVDVLGAGGGGGSSTGSGTNGGNSTFGTSLLTANGGAGSGGVSTSGGLGGTVTITLSANVEQIIAVSGSDGQASLTGAAGVQFPGGLGGQSFFGGLGTLNYSTGNGGSGKTNSGSGGGGGYGVGGTTSPSGGGSGGYLKALIKNPSLSGYSYAVGAGGAGGSTGTYLGGNGAAGIIIVKEFYQ